MFGSCDLPKRMKVRFGRMFDLPEDMIRCIGLFLYQESLPLHLTCRFIHDVLGPPERQNVIAYFPLMDWLLIEGNDTKLTLQQGCAILKHGTQELMDQVYDAPRASMWFCRYLDTMSEECVMECGVLLGSLEACKWARERHGEKWLHMYARTALRLGHIDILRWAQGLGLSFNQRTLLMEAGRKGCLEAVELFQDYGSWCSQSSSNTMYDFVHHVSQEHQWHILQWCFDNSKFEWDEDMQEIIRVYGGPEVLREYFGRYL